MVATVLMLAVAGASPGASADPISEQTTCRTVRAIFDAGNPDRAQIRAIADTITRVFEDLDSKRRSRVYARLSTDGKETMSAAVTVRCEDYPKDSIRQSVETVYRGIEAMGRAVGAN